MASRNVLETVIKIGAEVGGGFTEVGSTLSQLGSIVDGLSQKLIDFGGDSIGIYRDYEKSMADAEVALSTAYGKGTRELAQVMSGIDTQATEWAATTIFHTNDVANAIAEAAHAGWDYERIMSGIPAAMKLAQAGGLDLSEAVNYIVKSTDAAGVGFDDLGTFIDEWAFAANRSASDIGEFGDAMLRMGSTMRFTGSTEELMTLIAVTANAGSTGSEAGTLIRNSILRLIAPTEKASDAMAELGASGDEIEELADDAALAAANAALAAEGFSAFDEQGDLKDVLDIYRELYIALGDIAGGFDKIETNEDSLKTLAAIFPTRTITEALTLIRAASEDYDGLYNDMVNGAAAGYGDYASDRMMDTLDGRIETFESKVERLKQLVGEELSGQLSDALSGMGEIIDGVSGLADDGTLGAIVTGLEVVAAAGPGLLGTGMAFRFIGRMLASPAGLIGTLAIGTAAVARAMKQMDEVDFANGFGLAELDEEAIRSYLTGLGEDFKAGYTEINAFRDALDKSVESYQAASAEFSGSLLTGMLTGETFTPDEVERLNSLGNDMYAAVLEGITQGSAASLSYWNMLFGGEGTAELDPVYQDIALLTNDAYENAIAEAQGISQRLRDAMTSAFDDGQVTEEEYQELLSYLRDYNAAIARASNEAQSEEDYISQQMLLHRAQTASLDEIKGMSAEIAEERDSVLAAAEEAYLRERYRLEYNYNQAIETGGMVGGETATVERRDAALAAVEAEYEQHRIAQAESYDSIMYRLWDSQVRQSEYADAYTALEELAGSVLRGEVLPDAAVAAYQGMGYGRNRYAGEDDYGQSDLRTRVSEVLARQIAGFGGLEELVKHIDDYMENGQEEEANRLMTLYAMQQINDNYAKTDVVGYSGIAAAILGEDQVTSDVLDDHYSSVFRQSQRDTFLEELANFTPEGYSLDSARAALEALGDREGSIAGLFDSMRGFLAGEAGYDDIESAYAGLSDANRVQLESILARVGEYYDLASIPVAEGAENLGELYQLFSLLYGEASGMAGDFLLTADLDTTEAEEELAALDGQEVTVTADTDINLGVDTTDAEEQVADFLDGQGDFLLTTDLDTTEAEEELAALDGQEVTVIADTDINLDVDTTDAEEQVADFLDGQGDYLLTAELDTTEAEEALAALDGQEVTVIADTDINLLGGTPADIARDMVEALGNEQSSIAAVFDAIKIGIDTGDYTELTAAFGSLTTESQEQLATMGEMLTEAYDFNRVLQDTAGSIAIAQENNPFREWYAAYSLLFGEASGMAENYRFTVDVDGDTALLGEAIDAENGRELLELVDGDTALLSEGISAQDLRLLTAIVQGDTSPLAAAIARYNGTVVNVALRGIAGLAAYAEGGRADGPSIFGEAGAEWAIPEEHSERTAELLDAARAASGFTWGEILGRFGGLNANPQNQPTTIIYSPVIHAADASGVEQVLKDDKKRLEKWFADKQMLDELEVYR